MSKVLKGTKHLPEGLLDKVKATLTRERFDVPPGTVIPENILRVELLVFHPGGELTLGSATDSVVAIIAEKVIFQDGNTQCSITVPKTVAKNGSNGKGGHSGSPHGGAGTAGSAGESGASLPPFVFIADEIEFVEEPDGGNSPLVIYAIGADGAAGGHGGAGGNGATGAVGTPGSSYREDGW